MSFDDNWQHAKVGESDGTLDPPDEGDFEVRLVDARAFTSKAGKDIVVLEVRVVDGGPHNDYQWTELRNFASQGAANAAKTTCDRIGVDVENIASLDDLDEALKQRIGDHCEVTVKRNGEYLNTYFNEAVPRPESGPAVPIASGGEPMGGNTQDDEDIPF